MYISIYSCVYSYDHMIFALANNIRVVHIFTYVCVRAYFMHKCIYIYILYLLDSDLSCHHVRRFLLQPCFLKQNFRHNTIVSLSATAKSCRRPKELPSKQ